MESGVGAKMKTANASLPVGADPHQPEPARADGHAVNFDKLVKNTINLDKFTGFFDKKRARETSASHCNKRDMDTNLSAGDSNTESKKFSSGAFARICAELSASPRISAQFGASALPARAVPERPLPSLPPQSGLSILEGRPPISRSTSKKATVSSSP